MKFKKFLVLLLALLLAASLVACGSIEDDDDEEDDSDITATETDRDDGDTDNQKDQNEDEEDKSDNVIFEEKHVTVTYKGYDEDGFFGPELSFSVTNDSDEDLSLSADSVAVNGYMTYVFLGLDIAAGKTESFTMDLNTYDLELCGIETVKDVEFILRLMDEDYDVIAESEMIKLTVTDKKVNQKYDDSGTVLLDKSGIKIVAKPTVNMDGILGPEVYFYIENNTDKNIVVTDWEGVLVNGQDLSGYLIADIYAGKKCVTDITVYEEDMAEKGITAISEVSFKVIVYEAESYETILPEEQVTIKY